jgi:hypothetical protein
MVGMIGVSIFSANKCFDYRDKIKDIGGVLQVLCLN